MQLHGLSIKYISIEINVRAGKRTFLSECVFVYPAKVYVWGCFGHLDLKTTDKIVDIRYT